MLGAASVHPCHIDPEAEVRVVAMSGGDQQGQHDSGGGGGVVRVEMSEPTAYNVPHSLALRMAVELTVSVRGADGKTVAVELYALGQATRAKVTRALCYMHAEQLVDYVTSKGSASLLASFDSLEGSLPPPLMEFAGQGHRIVPQPHHFATWDTFVTACDAFVRAAQAAEKLKLYAAGELPRCPNPVAQRAAELMRLGPVSYSHDAALQRLNKHVPGASGAITCVHVLNQFHVATYVLNAQSGLTAQGVAATAKMARHRCAAHAIGILEQLRADAMDTRGSSSRPPRWHSSGSTDGSAADLPRAARTEAPAASAAQESAGTTLTGASLNAVLQQLQPSYRKVVKFSLLLFGSDSFAPKTSFTKVVGGNKSGSDSCDGGVPGYRCRLSLNGLTCEATGLNRFEAQRAALSSAIAELLLHDPQLQSVHAFVKAHPSINPEAVPSVALPAALVGQLQTRLGPVVLQQRQTREALALAAEKNAGAAEKGSSVGSSGPDSEVDADAAEGDALDVPARGLSEQTLLRLSERAFAADPAYAAAMQHALAVLRQDPTYLTLFHPRRSTLAMARVRAQLLDAIAQHRVTVVCGTTGCGKTTQVPQYILDGEIEAGRGGLCNILVTQPRRLSSFSVAERIAQERLSAVGRDVGYAVRLDSRPGRHITICTTGVLLASLSLHPDLEHVSHLIIDEVHERDINCDVVLALVKQLLPRNPRLRVVLMSATLQADVFARYFGADTPVVQVEGAVYPVAVRYLQDIATEAAAAKFYSPAFDKLPLKGLSGNALTPAASSSVAARGGDRASKTLVPDYNLIAYLVHRAVQVDLQGSTEGKSILVFLPGWKELTSAMTAIQDYSGPYALPADGPRFHIILLHSSVDAAKQRQCFLPPPPGMVKVVLATNIAESGITIDDAAVVIDTGLIKTTAWASRASIRHPQQQPSTSASGGRRDAAYVPLDELSTDTAVSAAPAAAPVYSTQLKLGYASQANGTQRKGRAGRTQGGVCYRLFTKELWDSLPAFPEADIHRVPLMQVLLKLLSLGYGNPKETLQTFLEPPATGNVEASLQLLRGIGAVGHSDKITPLGEYLALLPCDPRIGKMIIMGAVLQCLDSVLTVAACTDVSPYVASREHGMMSRHKRFLFSRGSQSDHISFLNAYNAFCANGESSEFASFNLLHEGNLRVISKYKMQFRGILRDAGLITEFQEEAAAADQTQGEGIGALQQPVTGESGAAGAAPTATASAAAPAVYHGALCVDTSALSRHSLDVALVKACVCAALFPNVAVLRPPAKALSGNRREVRAKRVELRTKHFHVISPTKDSVCRRVGGPRDPTAEANARVAAAPPTAAAAPGRTADTSSPPPPPLPALFYVFQDVFGLRDVRMDFVTNLSAVSLWALLLFGASESTTTHHADLSLCVVDRWVAVHVDGTTYAFVSALRQALYECLRRKYHDPRDAENNAALATVTALCRTLLQTPAEATQAGESDSVGTDNGVIKSSAGAKGGAALWQLADTGSIIDPLVLQRLDGGAAAAPWTGAGVAHEAAEDDDDGDDANPDFDISGLDDDDEDGSEVADQTV